MGVRTKTTDKPDVLVAVDLIKMTGQPLVAGGLMDQPHIWLLQLEMVNGVVSLMEALNALADNPTR